MKKGLLVTVFIAGCFLVIGASEGFAGVKEYASWKAATDHKSAADFLLKNERYQEAVQEYGKTLTLDPSFRSAYFNLAIALYALGDIDGTISTLEKLIELDPGDAEAMYNLACMKLYRQDPQGAEKWLRQAKECCPLTSPLSLAIEQGEEFFHDFNQRNLDYRSAILFLLQAGLPPSPLSTTSPVN